MIINELFRNIPHKGSSARDISSIEYDSRKAGEDTLFVCLRGAVTDGHKYAPSAYSKGCRAFLCEEELSLPEDAEQIIVKDSRATLAMASAEFYGHPAESLKIIGITGTKGKTTTALLIHGILNSAGENCAYIGSNGILINGVMHESANTTPESHVLHKYFRQMVDAGVRYVALEVSSQALARNRVDGIIFDTVVFTNLGEDHISPVEHPDLEDYKNSKAKLFTAAYGAKRAVYNADDEASEYMLRRFTGSRVSFSMEGDADYVGRYKSIYRSATSLGVVFDCIREGEATETHLMSPGAFSIYNALAAIAVCAGYGVSVDISANALGRTPVQGRFEIVEAAPERTFVVDYSHNGLSLTKALTTLREYEPARLICVFGSVGGRTQGRRRELAEVASELADFSIITSDNPDFEDPDAIVAEIASYMKEGSDYLCITDRAEAVAEAVAMSKAGDIILFAGKGHETYQLVEGKKLPFSERELILDACKMAEMV
ncbi:MAG: UDP-N-acetylmuramoyl-L-alanyl-D-glutamate--2,6-diaminopimelate ligase [Clostridia bacterium]|nr:UDP-N-acetylmuramoyl-L-alanyl-D-glutamate--2,6-diaminopimelate ligase [Clostridia bacterium]